jgi:general stress protein 26
MHFQQPVRVAEVEGRLRQQRAQRRHALWNTATQAWFPNGPDDPDVALVRVRITHAEYWDVHDSKLVQLYKMARAAVTGHPPTDMGDTGQVRMH